MSEAPRILISAATALPDAAANYEAAVRAAGGVPVVRYAPAVDLDFDGLLLTGGGDVDPARFGQANCGSGAPDPARDEAELALAAAYLSAGKPILGICRGHQIINVALGGTLIQDLGETLNLFHRHPPGEDDRVHPVLARPGSLLHTLYGRVFLTNSSHHQAVDAPGRGLIVTARSEGGVAECIELPGRPVLGVQFHPERMTGAKSRPGCVDGDAIFRRFMEQCR